MCTFVGDTLSTCEKIRRYPLLRCSTESIRWQFVDNRGMADGVKRLAKIDENSSCHLALVHSLTYLVGEQCDGVFGRPFSSVTKLTFG